MDVFVCYANEALIALDCAKVKQDTANHVALVGCAGGPVAATCSAVWPTPRAACFAARWRAGHLQTT